MKDHLKAGVTIVAALSLFAIAIEASDNYTVNHGAEENITAHTECRKVTNESATGLSVYVPTQTLAEWQSFYGNPPVGVAIMSCAIDIPVTSSSNHNLCTLAGNPTTPGDYVFTINNGVVISSNSTSQPALTTGTCWPAGSTVTIINNGAIYGRGGNGGKGGNKETGGSNGSAGGNAIALSYPLTIDTSNGYIFGGGGGGGGGGACRFGKLGNSSTGGGGGGGGQGSINSSGGAGSTGTSRNGSGGSSGTITAPGNGGSGGSGSSASKASNGGRGGTWGAAGSTASGGNCTAPQTPRLYPSGSGGAAGKAIDTNGHAVTWLGGNNSTHVRGAVSN